MASPSRALLFGLLFITACAINGNTYHPFHGGYHSVIRQANLYKAPQESTTASTGLYLPADAAVKVIGWTGYWVVVRTTSGKFFARACDLSDEPLPTYYYTGTRQYMTGPCGGTYYINGNGNKTYITPPSTLYERDVRTGPRGGEFYYNDNGNKVYIKK